MKSKNRAELLNYNKYTFKTKDILLYGSAAAVLDIVFAYFFYRSPIAVIPLLIISYLYLKHIKSTLIKKRKESLKVQFKELILHIAAGQRAGYSAENAVRDSIGDMASMFGDNSLICNELMVIKGGLDNHVQLDLLLQELGRRSGVEEIQEFGEIFSAAKKSGGNMADMIENTADIITQKMDVDREIQVLLSARKFEQDIMNVVPFGILLYVNATSKGFFDILYHNPAGIVLMSCCLLGYLGAVYMQGRIMNISV